MWTPESRLKYQRTGRYPSDTTDAEWALLEPFLPAERRVPRRPLLDAIFYLLGTGCQWRALPKDFPAKSTVHDYFIEIDRDGTLTRIHHALYTKARELAERNAEPTLAIVDSQSVKSAEKGGKTLIRLDMTQARRLKGRSVTSPWIRKDCSSTSP